MRLRDIIADVIGCISLFLTFYLLLVMVPLL